MKDHSSKAQTHLEELIGSIAEEYVQRLCDGDEPNVEEYARDYPEAAEPLRQILPALEIMAGGLSQQSLVAQQSVSTALGDFRLMGEIGRGGMGVVYEAEQVSVGRRVALKILPFVALLHEHQLERFATEATAASRLQHESIVTVYSVGCERGIHFIAMQLIEGPSLSQVITELRHERHPDEKQQESADTVVAKKADVLTRDEDGGHYRAVARIGREAAEALQYAHENGVLHRDIKPSNLLLDKEGHVWIADFGLARVEDESQLTRTGDILGTLHYMSPEQATGQRDQIDARSDVYGLGATLYELATLRPVFDNADRGEVIKQVVAGNPVAPHKIDRSIPKPLSLVISKAMARRLDERYKSAQELAEDLQRFLDGEPVSAKPPTLLRRASSWSRRHRLASTAIAGLLILVLLLPFSTHYFFQRVPDDSQSKGQDMKVSKAAKIAAAAAAVAIVASGVNAKKPPKPPPGDAVPNPSNLVVSAATEDSITLEWTSGGGTTAGFKVAYLEGTKYPRPNLRGATVIDVGNQEYCTVGGLKTDQVYSFRVCAVDSKGNRSEGVTVQGSTVSAPPVLYEVVDNYAEFVDESTYLGAGCSAPQWDDSAQQWKYIITATAQPNIEPLVLVGGEHFVGRMNDDGTVDTTFGANGYHQLDIQNDGDVTLDNPRTPIVLPNGKLLVAGTSGADRWYLAQYHADGTLDIDGFGADGVLVDYVPGVSVAKNFTVSVRPDGKIVGAVTLDGTCTVLQYNSDGSPDADFGVGSDGMTSFVHSEVAYSGTREVILLPDGTIAVVGMGGLNDGRTVSMIYKFDEIGAIDFGFGDNGCAFVDFWPEIDQGAGPGPNQIGWEFPIGIVQQADEKLLIYGTRAGFLEDGSYVYSYNRCLARFNADGSVDTGFGSNGMVIPEKAANYAIEDYRAVGLQDDGKVVVLGWANTGDIMQQDLTIERFNINGSRDYSFDGTGRIVFATSGSEMSMGMHLRDDGAIVIGGTHTDVDPGGLSRGLLLYLIPM